MRFRDQGIVLAMVALLTILGGCTPTPPGDEEEAESVVVTVWNDDFELFMEYPQLMVGEPAGFAAHLTVLETFEPLREGTVGFHFSADSLPAVEDVLAEPLRAGLYVPELTFPRAGRYRLTIRIDSPQGSGQVLLEDVIVHDPAEAPGPPEEGFVVQGDRITYLKEQQWKLGFRTELARRALLRQSIPASGVVAAVPDRDYRILPPVAGRYLAPPGGAPSVGARVQANQLLGSVEPPLSEQALLDSNRAATQAARAQLQERVAALQAQVVELEAGAEQARRERARVERLFEVQAVAEKRLEESRHAVAVVDAALASARSSLLSTREALKRLGEDDRSAAADPRIPIFAPGAGTVVATHGSPGAFVGRDTLLFRITDLSRVWVRADVPEGQIHQLRDVTAGRIVLPDGGSIDLGAPGSRLISAGDVVDPRTRTVSQIWAIDNADRRLRLGQLVDLRVFMGEAVEALAVSASAVFREDNKRVVYVHASGETFDRRIVETGIEDGGAIQILSGLSEGERVVVEGGYEVALAARSSSEAGAGHVH